MKSKLYDISIENKNNKIYCKVKPCDVSDDKFEYAFYLKKNGQRVNTKWYSMENFVYFPIDGRGVYSVACFIRDEIGMHVIETEGIYVSNKEDDYIENDEELKTTASISIFGSCVTRDVFELDTQKRLMLKTYVARQAIASAVSEPIECALEDINLESKFQRQQVYYDLTKASFDLFANDNSQYLIIDLIDERFRLIKKDGKIFTNSTYLEQSDYFQDKQIISYEYLDGEYWVDAKRLSDYIDEFCKRISTIYLGEHVILHKAYMLDYYVNKAGEVKEFPPNYLKQNKTVNMRLDYMYNRIISNIPNLRIIDVCNNAIADEKHRWGLAPMHYCENYYQEVLTKLYDICAV